MGERGAAGEYGASPGATKMMAIQGLFLQMDVSSNTPLNYLSIGPSLIGTTFLSASDVQPYRAGPCLLPRERALYRGWVRTSVYAWTHLLRLLSRACVHSTSKWRRLLKNPFQQYFLPFSWPWAKTDRFCFWFPTIFIHLIRKTADGGDPIVCLEDKSLDVDVHQEDQITDVVCVSLVALWQLNLKLPWGI